MKNQFKVGDKVKVREDLVEGRKYGDLVFLAGYMSSFKGHIFTVDKVEDGCYSGRENPFYWSEEMLVSAITDKVIFNGKATVLIKDGKKYVSKCKDGDAYDKEKGLLLCLAQANGISYKDLQEMIAGAKDNNLEKAKEFAVKFGTALCECIKAFQKSYNGEKADDKAQVREVKRRAKVGEYIKIVNPEMTFGDYEEGDIFKVVKADENGVYREGDENDECTYIYNKEYVVLENYKPYKITLSEFLAAYQDDVAIHCKTEDEAKELLKAFDKAGKRWNDRSNYTSKTEWKWHEEKTVYTNDGYYGSICGSWVKEKKPTIYEFNEVDLEN